MIGRARHLAEERLFECYFAERGGEPVDPPSAEHLADCPSCGDRFGELARFMDRLRSDADAETDALFPADILRQQQQQIARRLELLARPPRVLSFPVRVGRTMTATASRVAPRWVAGAAAAGLFIGVAAGRYYDVGQHRPAPSVASRPARLTAPSVAMNSPLPAIDVDEDVVFLSELEMALDRPRTRELLPFDALTPHVREIRNQLR